MFYCDIIILDIVFLGKVGCVCIGKTLSTSRESRKIFLCLLFVNGYVYFDQANDVMHQGEFLPFDSPVFVLIVFIHSAPWFLPGAFFVIENVLTFLSKCLYSNKEIKIQTKIVYL